MKTEEIKKTQEMKVLKDIFVTYEIAQKLKEIGFDEPCIAVYNPMKEIEIGFHELLIRTNFISEEQLIIGDFNKQNNIDYRSAPTWEQVFKWFRDKSINGYVLPNFEQSFQWYISDYSKRTEEKVSVYRPDLTEIYFIYEEAREKLVLKLIEIYKNEKLYEVFSKTI